MTLTPRRSIEEVSSRCELEPSLRDLVVEGVADQRFLSRVLRDLGLVHVAVYQIGAFEVGSNLVPVGESIGNRGRVVGLAAELRRHYPGTVDGVLCIIDSDTDALLGVEAQSENLATTDFSDLPMYAWAPEPLGAVMTDILRSPIDSATLLSMFEPHLREVGLIRAGNRLLSLGLTMLPIASDLDTVVGGSISFNRDRYLERVLGTQHRHGDRAELEEAVDSLRATMPRDPRLCICSEDYAEALRWHAGRVAPAFGRLAASDLLRILVSHVSSDAVAESPLLVRVREFAVQH